MTVRLEVIADVALDPDHPYLWRTYDAELDVPTMPDPHHEGV